MNDKIYYYYGLRSRTSDVSEQYSPPQQRLFVLTRVQTPQQKFFLCLWKSYLIIVDSLRCVRFWFMQCIWQRDSRQSSSLCAMIH